MAFQYVLNDKYGIMNKSPAFHVMAVLVQQIFLIYNEDQVFLSKYLFLQGIINIVPYSMLKIL